MWGREWAGVRWGREWAGMEWDMLWSRASLRQTGKADTSLRRPPMLGQSRSNTQAGPLALLVSNPRLGSEERGARSPQSSERRP
jgi:hypothetical protein